MDHHMNPIPSPARIRDLSTLCKALPVPPVSIPDALRASHDILRSPPTRSFLFSPNPDHIPHILRPASLQPALLCATTTTGVDLNAPPSTPYRLAGSSHHQASYSLLLPASQQGLVTLGYGVYHAMLNGSALRAGQIVAQREERMNFRFAHDARTRNLLLVFDDVDNNSYFLYSVCPQSTRSERIFNGIFAKPLLKKLALRDEEFRLDHLSASMLMLEDRRPSYPCVVCASPNDCDCKLEPLELTMNFGHFMKAMAYHTRCTTVNAVRINIMRGAQETFSQSVIVGTRYSLQGILDDSVQDELKSWSVWDFTRRLRQDPRESVSLLNLTSTGDSLQLLAAARNMGDVESPVLKKSLEHTDVGESTNRDTLHANCNVCINGLSSSVVRDGGTQEVQTSRPRNASGHYCCPEGFLTLSTEISLPKHNAGIHLSSAQAHPADSSVPIARSELCKSAHMKSEKVRLRKEANRASAHRSNLRKRAMLMAMRDEIQQNREQAERLRKVEVALQMENSFMRNLVEKRQDPLSSALQWLSNEKL